MKQKEKDTQKPQTEDTKSKLLLLDEPTDNKNLTSEKKKGEELIQRDDVENTPFQIITINKESFGVFGKYRITEPYHTKQQCRVELLKMDWNNVVKIITLCVEMINEHNKKTLKKS